MCLRKEKVLLWGAGNTVKEMLRNISCFQDCISIIGIADNDERKWGTTIDGIRVTSFQEVLHTSFDKIVIASGIYFDEIRKNLIEKWGIADEKIENQHYFAKIRLIARYCGSREKDIQNIVKYLETNRLDVFNYEFAEKYMNLNPEIFFDEDVNMFYVMHFGRKMYMARKLDTKQKVLKYYQSLCVEQDTESPHLYLDEQFTVGKGDIVVDVGVAEGNFSLQIIDEVSKIYMIETDEEWIEALRLTFASYTEKVVIINKFISDYVLGNTDSLDNLIEDKVNFIKMDIEGCECEALSGAKKLVEKSDRIKCAICAYHRDNDEVQIEKIAHLMKLTKIPVKGYMYYYNDEKQRYISPILRRGVLRYERRS